MDYSELIKGCYFPYTPPDSAMRLPCGRCPNCLKRRIDGWVFRIQQHMKHVESAHFVTLTYAPDGAIPIDRTKNGFLTLSKKHVQNFCKRLRKFAGDNSETPFNQRIKYIASGEYGDSGKRPHYHLIILNSNPADITRAWSINGRPIGFVDVKEVTTSRIAYTFKYIQKRRLSKFRKMHSRDDREPEFTNISQGIGKQWLDSEAVMRKHKGNTTQPYVIMQGGARIAIPRYYKKYLYTDDEKLDIAKFMEQNYEPLRLTPEEEKTLLDYKNEKIRIMNKKAKKDAL